MRPEISQKDLLDAIQAGNTHILSGRSGYIITKGKEYGLKRVAHEAKGLPYCKMGRYHFCDADFFAKITDLKD